jgi:eukaryotic-like serine/threonine-protein kinase
MSKSLADRNLLFGILALQMDFVTRDGLIAAMNAWVLDKVKPLGAILQAQGGLAEDEHALVEALVAKHLSKHGGDAERSLAAVANPKSLPLGLDHVLDADLVKALAELSRSTEGRDDRAPGEGTRAGGSEADPDLTASWSLGSATSSGGRFYILRPHAQGGLGRVSVAMDAELHREVAVKEILPEQADDPKSRARFLLEAEVTGRLEHPGIVPVYGLGTSSDGRPYYAMRFVRGESLKEAISHLHRGDTEAGAPLEWSLELRKLLARFLDVCNAMEYAHSRGVIHRDLKPSNVLLGPYGETLVVDWGLAKIVGRPDPNAPATEATLKPASASGSSETVAGTAIGTPTYMSPEQAEGRLEDLGPASDIYSLGATLYSLLTGRAPFESADIAEVLRQVQRGEFPLPRQVNRRVPRPLEAVVKKAMAHEGDARYRSARALAEDIEHWLADEPVSAHREDFRARLWRTARRRRAWVQAGAATLLLVSGVSVAAALLIDRARVRAESARRNERAARKDADTSAAAARDDRRRAMESLHDIRRLSARWALDRGLTFGGQGRADLALLWLARGLQLAHQDDPGLERALRLNIGGWAREVHRLSQSMAQPGEIIAAALDPEGRVLMTGCAGGGIRFWDVRSGQPLGKPAQLPADVRAVALGPGARIGLSGCDDGTARLWDVGTGHAVGQPMVHAAEVRAVAFGTDGRRVLTGSDDGTARLWDAATGRPVGEPLAHRGWVQAIALSPDGRTILTGSSDQSARLWDAATGRLLGPPLEHTGAVNTVAFSPDGSIAATGGADGNVRLWDVPGGKARGTPLSHPQGVATVVFRHNGDMLATGCLDGAARIWDAKTGRLVGSPIWHKSKLRAATFSPDGSLVLTGSDDGTARVWETATGRPVGQPLEHRGVVRTVAFSPDGRLIVTGGGDAIARLWEVAPGIGRGQAMGHQRFVNSVAFRPDGRAILTGSFDRTARLWEVETGRPLGPPLVHLSDVGAVAFSPDGSIALTGGRNGTAQLWDLAASKAIGPPMAHRQAITAVAISPDGSIVLTASVDGSARLWDAHTGAPVGPPMQHQGSIFGVAFTADSQTAVTSGLDGTIRFWDARTGGLKRPPIGVRGHVHSLAVSPDSKTILAGGDRIAWFCDVESGRVRGEPLEHKSEVSVVAFSPTGSLATTYSDEGVVRLWEVSTGRPVGPPRTVGASICKAFSPDETMLLAGRADGTARLWDVATGHPLGPPLMHRSEVVSVAFRGDGRMVATGDDQSAHLWDAPEEVAGDPARLLLWAEVITNQQFDAEGDAIRLMDAPTWDEHRRRQTNRQGKEDGSPPAHGDPTFASRQSLGPGGQARGGLFVRSVAFSSVHP